MKRIAILIPLFLLAVYCFAKDDKSDQKNKKIVEREENRFQKDLDKNPGSATPYLDHANNLAAINSECSRAGDFYKLALKYDSANAEIYKDYGRYLFDILRSYHDAKAMLEKALALSGNDEETKKYLESTNKMIALQDEDSKMRDFGITSVKELNPNGNYTAMTKFDSLKILIAEPGNKFFYQNLLSRFMEDDASLAAEEMYMMIVGYSRQNTYSPFNYNDINDMKRLANHNLDTAIKKGIELTKTNPLNPSLNRELMYYYRKKGETQAAEKYLNRIKQFFSGILYSGNGSCNRPYISLWAKEEYNFISYLGFKATQNHSMGMCAGQMAETIDVTDPATQKTEQINFNVALIYMQEVGK